MPENLSAYERISKLLRRFAILFMRTLLLIMLVNGVQLLFSNFFTAIGKVLKGLLLS